MNPIVWAIKYVAFIELQRSAARLPPWIRYAVHRFMLVSAVLLASPELARINGSIAPEVLLRQGYGAPVDMWAVG